MCILDSSAAHTSPQFTPLTRRKTGISRRHSRQCTNQLGFHGRLRVGLQCSTR